MSATEQHSVVWRIFDVASKVANIATPVVLGWATIYLTWSDQQRQSSQATANIILKVIELTISKDDTTKSVGFRILSDIQNNDMGGLLDHHFVTTDNFTKLLSTLSDIIQAGGAGSATPTGPAAAAPSDVSPASTVANWVYLGTWIAESKTWQTRYLDFKKDVAPETLKGKTLTVPVEVGAIYLRSGPSTGNGLDPIIGLRRPGQTVTVEDVQAGSRGSHFWARVTF
jgi:hypothetical protein